MSNLARKEKYAIKVEASQGEQLSLFDDVELLIEIENTKEKIEEINSIKVEGYKRKKSKNVVNIENANLPIEVIDVKLDEEGLTEIGSPEIVRRLHVIPRQFFIREYHIHKYLKNTEAGKTIVITGKNDEYYNPLGKEMVTPSVVSMIACDKVINSLPLYRQEKQLKTEGIELSRYSMSNYLKKAYEITLPVINGISDYIKSAEINRSDETSFKIIKNNGKGINSARNSYCWVFSTGFGYHPAVQYLVGPTRSRDVLVNYFGSQKRYLISDGYNAYKNVDSITNVYCLTHIRRKFFSCKVDKTDDPATIIVASIDKIYHYENLLRQECGNNFEILKEKRMQVIIPLLNSLYSYIEKTAINTHKSSQLGKAIIYAIECKDGLFNYLKDGRLEIDNNASERHVKPYVIGRKNWLFSFTKNGAEITCGLYTLIRTAVENRINANKYLEYLLNTLGKNPSCDVSNLLPRSEEIKEKFGLK